MRTRHDVFLSSIVAAVATLFCAAGGCSLITKTDRTLIPDGGGGAGGDTTTTTGTTGGGGGGTTTSTGGGGGGPCTAECCVASDCPVPDDECVNRVCDAGKCGTAPVAEGVAVSTQTDGDCKQIVCDGAGATKAIADDADLPDDGKECTIDKCQNGTPKNTPAPAGQACSEAGGKKCDGSGACLECLAPSDCESKVCTIAGACAVATCGDGAKNGDETDTDCGGICGATCTTNKSCNTAADCLNGVCSGSPKKCAAPTCMDGIENGDETDQDCGGACGATCGPAEMCSKNGDCKGGTCTGSTCAESCSDGVLNNSEKGVDCGGPSCASTCANGTACDVASDCTSGFCVDGVCCDVACTGACRACAASKKTSGADGVCGSAKQGTDPHADCGVSAPATCGDSTGECDGAGACEKWPALTPCGDSPSCANGVQTNQDTCNGTGACTDKATTPCGLYACGAAQCNATCAGDGDCGSTAYCVAPSCVVKKADGQSCAGANQCANGFCVDGVCCATACTGLCQACTAAKKGAGANGTCGSVAAGTDPESECPGLTACSGAGACALFAPGTACSSAAECASGSCVDGVCCDTACGGLCRACVAAKTGFADGTCANVATGTDPDDECPDPQTCAAGSCQ